ncbi:MAG TPA: molybdopterin-dependent oxidoreductase [Blastocatellia bacterium]|nr:molybdopterin-dependent oxidoreductase [Blastocatellia bacterium]
MDILQLNLNKTEPDSATEDEIRFQLALVGAIACAAAGLLARFLFDAPLVPELMAHLLFSISPIILVEIAVGFLGSFAKHMGFLACLVVYVALLIAAAMGFLRFVAPRVKTINRSFLLLAFSFGVCVVTVVLIFPLLGGGLFGQYLQQGAVYTLISQFIIHAVYGAVLVLVSRLYAERPEVAVANNTRLSRRRVMRAVGYSVLAIGIYDIGKTLLGSWLERGAGRVRAGTGVFPEIEGLALEITPNDDFYVVSKNPFDPRVDQKSWRLQISGLVERPFSLSFDEIKALPPVDQYSTLCCISNDVGGDLIGNALWRGVRLKDLIDQAGLKAEAVDIVLRASDGYSDSIPVSRALADGNILVYEMNGEPLSVAHGFPVRLIVPGIYGKKNVKWITEIEAVGYDYKGFWQSRGWDDRAVYKTMSRIDAPEGTVSGSATIAGIAFAGDRGISKVEVSLDGGNTWEQAEIKPALSEYSWVLWHKEWNPARVGRHLIKVRATDKTGTTQAAAYAPPYPNGSSGYDSRKVSSE